MVPWPGLEFRAAYKEGNGLRLSLFFASWLWIQCYKLLQALIVLTSSCGLNQEFPPWDNVFEHLVGGAVSCYGVCWRMYVTGGGPWEFMISPHFQFSLSALCMQLRCDLRIPAFGAMPFHQYENLSSRIISQNKLFLKFPLVLVFYHCNWKVTNIEVGAKKWDCCCKEPGNVYLEECGRL